MNIIDFRDLPNQTNLFLDYIYDFEKVAEFYNGNYFSPEDLVRILENIKSHIDRNILCDILLSENKEDKSVIKNIELLRSQNTFAVVTGQQIGIFGGPLYTFYKIYTSIKLAEDLNNKYSEYNFIPIFWMESEDHDFNEINKVKIIDKTNNFFTHEYYPDGYSSESSFGSTGKIIVDNNFKNFVQNVLNTLPYTDFHDELVNLLNYYSEGNNLADSFKYFVKDFFKDYGVIFLNPNNESIKNLLKPIFEQELNTFPKTSELVIDISAKLEQVYHAQVKAHPINLFMHHKKGRFLIEPSGEEFSLKGTRQKFRKLEIVELLNTSPSVFSPNVLLRPICQDYILPTCIYVAGPSEIAYFAQLKPVYNYFKITMPILYPRTSVTLIESKIRKILDKYKISFSELLANYDGVLRKVSDEVSNIKIDLEFSKINNHIDTIFNDLEGITKSIDPTLINNINNSKSKVEHIFSVVKDKLFNAQIKNNNIAIEQINKVKLNLFPKGNLQERELNIIYYLNKYSKQITKKIFDEIDITNFNHQLIDI